MAVVSDTRMLTAQRTIKHKSYFLKRWSALNVTLYQLVK